MLYRIEIVLVLLLVTGLCAAAAPNRSWVTETVDKLSSRGISLAVDKEGNLHVSYVTDQGDVKYAFRPAGSSRWFTIKIAQGFPYYGHGGGMFTRIVTDVSDNPHVCFTAPPTYAFYLAGKWRVEQLNSPGGGYACGIAVAPDGTPHLSWYQEKNEGEPDFYLHLKYAVRRDNAWLLKTIDFDRATGKWNQLVLDEKGFPHLCYSAWDAGQMKYAAFDGKEWQLQVVDSGRLGWGNSMAIGGNGLSHLSYFSSKELKYARQESTSWAIQAVDLLTPRGGAFEDFRSSIALDSHALPHISYEDTGTVKYARYNGTSWVKESISAAGNEQILYNTIAVAPDDSVYVAYRDALSGAVTVASLSSRAPKAVAGASPQDRVVSPSATRPTGPRAGTEKEPKDPTK